jgi:hypothetical protein
MNVRVESTATKKMYATSVPWIILGFGIILRLGQYVYNRSLTEGEAALAYNIVYRSYAELVKPLDFSQAAPVGFLMIQKFLVNTLGNNEYALRLFPLIAGILALFLFYEVAKKSISTSAVPIALILFAVGDYLIYFSSEVKQYSSDVALTLLLVLIVITMMQRRLAPQHIFLFGFLGALSFWFSHPALFTFGAAGIVLIMCVVRRRQWHALVWLSIAGALAAVSLAIHYIASLDVLSKNAGLLETWQQTFVPFPPTSLADIQWYGYSFLRVFKNPLGLSIYELFLTVLSFVAGIIIFYVHNKKILLIFLLPIVLTLIASHLHLYPFQGRLLLFITPLMFLVITQGIDYIRKCVTGRSKIIGSMLVVLLLIHPVILAGYHLIKPRAPEELRPVISYLHDHHEAGDRIYVYYAAVNAFRYYSEKCDYTNNDYIIGVEARDNWSLYYKDLEKLNGIERVWIVFSHIATWEGVDEERLFLSYLTILGTRLDAFTAPGASVYLYDLSNSPSY